MNITVTDNEFLKQNPTDIHLRRLVQQFQLTEIEYIAHNFGMRDNSFHTISEILEDSEEIKFEMLHTCIDSSSITFDDIRKAVESWNIQTPHTICRVSCNSILNNLFYT